MGHIFKFHYKILNGKNIESHIFILRADNYDSAMKQFNSFIESNLHQGDKLFGVPSVTEIPNDFSKIYSSYV